MDFELSLVIVTSSYLCQVVDENTRGEVDRLHQSLVVLDILAGVENSREQGIALEIFEYSV